MSNIQISEELFSRLYPDKPAGRHNNRKVVALFVHAYRIRMVVKKTHQRERKPPLFFVYVLSFHV